MKHKKIITALALGLVATFATAVALPETASAHEKRERYGHRDDARRGHHYEGRHHHAPHSARHFVPGRFHRPPYYYRGRFHAYPPPHFRGHFRPIHGRDGSVRMWILFGF